MKALARAVVDAAAFLELTGDDLLAPDAAVKALEDIAYNLATCSAAERTAIKEAAEVRYQEERDAGASKQVLDFFLHFTKQLGIED